MKLKLPTKPKKRTSYPDWVFDNSPIADPFGFGERAVNFLRALKHPKNPLPGNAFQLDRWQERIVRAIYGPRHADGTRVVKTVVMMLPRGSRKTSLAAALALLHTFGPERTPGGEVLSAASDRSQAKIAFEEVRGVIQATGQSTNPNISKIESLARITDHKHKITNAKHGSFYACVSSDAASAHGHTPVFALVDEIHVWKKYDLWQAIKGGLNKTPGSLLVIATTAGRGQNNLAWEQIDYARKVARGDIEDPATLPVLFETSKDADWEDEAVWYRANPGLKHGYPDIGGLRQMAREAKERPSDRIAFQQFHLNIWQDNSLSPFVDMSVYDEGAAPIDFDQLRNRPCWIGVDMSVTTDLTAVVAAFRDDGDGYIVVPQFFCPEDRLPERAERDKVPYPLWADDGFIKPTPGNVIDYRAVEAHIRELCELYDVREIGFDKAYAQPVMAPLMEDGLPVVTIQQGWFTQSPALNILERAIVSRALQHGNHPVLRWCFSNVAIHTDSAGNRTMHKAKSTEKIDGAIATWMAVSRAAEGSDERSIYDTDERPDGILIF
ncbi:terminase [Rhizobium sp. AC44/96]|uniref:terminase large subunit n=1 Tax=Rhizobium sp. AC44/96 TaxID=1841654 RepID=UPI00080FAE6F|nr:terminase TerL endonuclease subunit [Rhizobium sp. AC44/96]OCJ05259.1 terminase [Rhizobium sp. AC44/96]